MAPKHDHVTLKTTARYSQRSKQAGNTITVWRDFTVGDFYFPLTRCKDPRTFYNSLEQKNHNSVALKRGTAESASLQ